MRLPNMAHGAVFVAGAYFAYLATLWRDIGFVLAVVAASLGAALLALLVDRIALLPIRNRATDPIDRELSLIIASIAAGGVVVSVAEVLTGSQIRHLPTGLLGLRTYRVAGLVVSNLQILVLLVAGVALLLTAIFLYRTRVGRAWRAVAVDPVAARLAGIDSSRVGGQCMTVGGALAGIGGILFSLQLNFLEAHMGELLLMKGFAVTILGGVGSMSGLLLGAGILALAETAMLAYGPAPWTNLVAFGVIIAVLLFRPSGLRAVATGARM
jgi:branched-chain amino acid transport system permease protein